ncbi:hypothetical protein D3C85_1296630 [compost metagenome]
MMNIMRQSNARIIQPASGAMITEDIGSVYWESPMARPRSELGNQFRNKMANDGQTTPSPSPIRKRTPIKEGRCST